LEKQDILKALKEVKEKSPSRAFTQTVDLVINLQYINIKKEDEKIDLFISLPVSKNKKPKICAIVDKQLESQAKANFDKVILKDEFQKYSANKKEIRKIAREYDYIVAQANLMVQIATVFGKYLGAKGKMPNPKAGCIIPPEANLTPLKTRLQNLIRLVTKGEPIIKAALGDEKMSDEDLAANALAIYNALINQLPQRKNNIKSVFVKLSMGPSYKIGQGLKIKEKTKNLKEEIKEKTAEVKKEKKSKK